MRVGLVTYLSTNWRGGGGEVKLHRTHEELRRLGVDAELFDMWAPIDRYDLFHVFGSVAHLSDFVREARARGKPVVVSSIFYRAGAGAWLYKLESAISARVRSNLPHAQRRRLFAEATFVCPNTEAEARQIRSFFGVPDERIRILPSGVDPRFAKGDPELFAQRFGLRDFVLYVGRIERRKNPLNLMLAVQGTGLPLVLVGGQQTLKSEGYIARTLRLAEQLGVTTTGRLDYEDPLLPAAFAAARVHALPSRLETPGQSNLQAALAGCALVAGDCPPIREYLGDEGAFWCDGRSVPSIRRALRAAWEQGPPPGLGERVVSRYSWTAVARRTLEIYQEALGRG
jgi:glycosyltransferase involved in cell wall biosynthesis